MGYPDTSGNAALPGSVGQLVPITITTAGLSATPSTSGTLTANLDSSAPVVAAANLPSAGGTGYTSTTTVTAYDNLGTPVTLNVYFSNMGGNQWEVDVYNNTTPSTGTPAIHHSAPFDLLAFERRSHRRFAASIAVPGGQTLNLNVSSMTQLDSAFGVTANTVNGNAPASYSSLAIGTDGTVSEVFSNGSTSPIAKIPLATVASVNNLTPHAGQTYSANPEFRRHHPRQRQFGGLRHHQFQPTRSLQPSISRPSSPTWLSRKMPIPRIPRHFRRDPTC